MPAATIPASSSEASRVLQPLARLADGVALGVVLRHDDDEAVRARGGELLQVIDQLAARDGLVGHHERHVERQAVALEVDDDVLDRAAPTRP